jgi:hypothetical protein
MHANVGFGARRLGKSIGRAFPCRHPAGPFPRSRINR